MGENDLSELAAVLAQTSQQLLAGVDDLRKATEELARQQIQLQLEGAGLAQHVKDAAVAREQIEALRAALANLKTSGALTTVLPLDTAELQKQLDALRDVIGRIGR